MYDQYTQCDTTFFFKNILTVKVSKKPIPQTKVFSVYGMFSWTHDISFVIGNCNQYCNTKREQNEIAHIFQFVIFPVLCPRIHVVRLKQLVFQKVVIKAFCWKWPQKSFFSYIWVRTKYAFLKKQQNYSQFFLDRPKETTMQETTEDTINL